MAWQQATLLAICCLLPAVRSYPNSSHTACCPNCQNAYHVILNDCSLCGNHYVTLFARSTVQLFCHPCETEPTEVNWSYHNSVVTVGNPFIYTTPNVSREQSVHCTGPHHLIWQSALHVKSIGASVHVTTCDLREINVECTLGYDGELNCSWLQPKNCKLAILEEVTVSPPDSVVHEFGCVLTRVPYVFDWGPRRISSSRIVVRCNASAFLALGTSRNLRQDVRIAMHYRLENALGVFRKYVSAQLDLRQLLAPATLDLLTVPGRDSVKLMLAHGSESYLPNRLRLSASLCLQTLDNQSNSHVCLSRNFTNPFIAEGLTPYHNYTLTFRLEDKAWNGNWHNATFRTLPDSPLGVVGGAYFAPHLNGVTLRFLTPPLAVARGPNVFYRVCADARPCVNISDTFVTFVRSCSRVENVASSLRLENCSTKVSITIGNAVGLARQSKRVTYVDQLPARAFRLWQGDVCLLGRNDNLIQSLVGRQNEINCRNRSAQDPTSSWVECHSGSTHFKPLTAHDCNIESVVLTERADGVLSFVPPCNPNLRASISLLQGARDDVGQLRFDVNCELTTNVDCDVEGYLVLSATNLVVKSIPFKTTCIRSKTIAGLVSGGALLTLVCVLAFAYRHRAWISGRVKRWWEQKREQPDGYVVYRMEKIIPTLEPRDPSDVPLFAAEHTPPLTHY